MMRSIPLEKVQSKSPQIRTTSPRIYSSQLLTRITAPEIQKQNPRLYSSQLTQTVVSKLHRFCMRFSSELFRGNTSLDEDSVAPSLSEEISVSNTFKFVLNVTVGVDSIPHVVGVGLLA
jgi:hypothetical protein